MDYIISEAEYLGGKSRIATIRDFAKFIIDNTGNRIDCNYQDVTDMLK